MLVTFQAISQEASYRNPIDGSTYVAQGGWKTYEPKDGVKPTDKKFLWMGFVYCSHKMKLQLELLQKT